MLKISLKDLNIDPLNWEKLALEWPRWRIAVKRGATQYKEERILPAQTRCRTSPKRQAAMPKPKAHIPLKTAFALATKRKWNWHKQPEMYMPNASPNARRPNATYIPLTCVEVWETQILGLASRVKQISAFFWNQHVGIPNTKLWRWGSKPTPGPNANGFASQWNIGLRVFCHVPSVTSNSEPEFLNFWIS